VASLVLAPSQVPDPSTQPAAQSVLSNQVGSVDPQHAETQRHHRSAREPRHPFPSKADELTTITPARANSHNAANHAARRTARLSPRPRPGGMAGRGKRGRVSNTKPSASATTNARRRRIQPARSSQPASQPACVAVAAAVDLHVMAWHGMARSGGARVSLETRGACTLERPCGSRKRTPCGVRTRAHTHTHTSR
jgi:hypothetical protein